MTTAVDPPREEITRAWRLWTKARLDPRARAHVEIVERGFEHKVVTLLLELIRSWFLEKDASLVEWLMRQRVAITNELIKRLE